MAVTILDVAGLKRLKNSIVGNAGAKRALAADGALLQSVIEYVNESPIPEGAGGSADAGDARRFAVRTEALYVIASLAQGSPDSLESLLECRAHQTILYALAHHQSSDPTTFCTALARAFKTLASSIADVVGPSDAGLQPDPISPKTAAHAALDYFFEESILDVYLPLLGSSIAPLRLGVAHALSRALRKPSHRRAVADWQPYSERATEGKPKRRWEQPGTVLNGTAYGGGWVARCLTEWTHSHDPKIVEVALLALAGLVQENPPTAVALSRPGPEGGSVLSIATTHCKSRFVDVQLAACLCAGRIMRANFPAMSTFNPAYPPDYQPAVIHTLNRILGSSEPESQRTRAAFMLHQLVADDMDLCRLAHKHGSLLRLTSLLVSITPLDVPRSLDWDVAEPASTSTLREACLTAVASMSMHDAGIREALIDTPGVIPALHTSLAHSAHPGCRYAACQCVRALGRAVAVVRTSLLDSGLGSAVIQVLLRNGDEDAPEDRRVIWAALAAVCNLVVDFPPLRSELLKESALARFVQLIHSPDAAIRLNALWAIKNLAWRAPGDVKRTVTDSVTWGIFLTSTYDSDPGVQEQAFAAVRNLLDDPFDIEPALTATGTLAFLDALSAGLDSEFPEVQAQAASLLANVALGAPSAQDALLAHPKLSDGLRRCVADARPTVRHPAVGAAAALIRGADSQRRRQLRALGLEAPLRALCDGAGAGARARGSSIGGDILHGSMMGVEGDREVKEKAREALHILEHDVDLEMVMSF